MNIYTQYTKMNRKLRIQIPILGLLILISVAVSGQERLISKASVEIEAGNFIKAEEQLENSKKKSSDNPFYLFTKYRFYASLSNVKFNIDSAHAYLLKSEESLKALNEDQLQKYCNEYQVCTTNFTELKNIVAEQAYHIYAKSNSIATLKDYKERYSNYPFIDIADEKIDSILYQNAEFENTITAYQLYLSKSTKNIFLKAAKKRIQIVAYDKATQINSVEAYKDYLKLYARPDQTTEIWNKIYEIAWIETQKLNTSTKYLQYHKDYPDSPYAERASKLFNEKAFLVPFLKANGKYIYVDSELMEPVITQEFDEAELFENNYAKVKSMGKYGIINKSGELIIPFKYHQLFLVENTKNILRVSLKNVSNEEKWGVIDAQSKIIIPIIYDHVEPSSSRNNYLAYNQVEKIRSYYFFDGNGKLTFSIKSDIGKEDSYSVHEHFVRTSFNSGKSVLSDYSGKIIVSYNWPRHLEPMENETGDVIYGIDDYFFDSKGNRKSKAGYVDHVDSGNANGEGLFPFEDRKYKLNGKFLHGYKDYNENIVIPANFLIANSFSEGLAAVVLAKNGVEYWSYIDKNGVEKIKTNLPVRNVFKDWGYSVYDFKYGFSWVRSLLSTDIYIFNRYGEMSSFEFEESWDNGFISRTWGKVAVIKTGDNSRNDSESKYGLIDIHGKLILPTKYKAIENIDENTFWVEDINDSWRLFNYAFGNFVSVAFENQPDKVNIESVGNFYKVYKSGKPIYLNANFKAYSDVK